MESSKIIIGIDPSFRENGFSVCVVENKTVSFLTFKRGFLDFQAWVINTFTSNEQKENVFVGVENSNLQNITFHAAVNKNVLAKISRNVGVNQAISQLTVDFCVDFFGAENVKGISPQEKGAKKKATKIENEKYFKELILDAKIRGYSFAPSKKKIGQDECDSYFIAMKCFG